MFEDWVVDLRGVKILRLVRALISLLRTSQIALYQKLGCCKICAKTFGWSPLKLLLCQRRHRKGHLYISQADFIKYFSRRRWPCSLKDLENSVLNLFGSFVTQYCHSNQFYFNPTLEFYLTKRDVFVGKSCITISRYYHVLDTLH